jgi:YkoY family integral membrane protein
MTLLAEATLWGNVGIVGVLILLEGLLSADNALVIALLVKHLPPKERRRALLVGLVGSFMMRLGAILLAKTLIQFWYLQALGAVYLLYLPFKHFVRARAESKGADFVKPKPLGFWQTVALVEFTDMVFAVDSILVAVTLSKNPVIVWIGGISGVVLLRFAAFILVRLLERMPGLEHMAYVLVAWVGLKLAFMSGHSFHEYTHLGPAIGEMNPYVFWTGMGVILVAGTWLSRRPAPTVI